MVRNIEHYVYVTSMYIVITVIKDMYHTPRVHTTYVIMHMYMYLPVHVHVNTVMYLHLHTHDYTVHTFLYKKHYQSAISRNVETYIA